jgi:CheY-like chemotaxis protein
LGNKNNNVIKALVVDDEAISRQISAKMIESQGLVVETADNGQEAFLLWQEKRHQLLITDCYMPVMDGFDLAHAIRNIEQTERCTATTIIALTANASEDEQKKCIQAGMDDFLTKPISIAKVTPFINLAMNAISAEKEQQTEAIIENPAQSLVDYAVLTEVFPEREKQMKVLHDLQKHIQSHLSELTRQIKHVDLSAVESVAHRMKGACKMVGVNSIASICAEIEQLAKNGVIANALTVDKLQQSIQAFDAYLDEQLNAVEQPKH